jgi:hypothetical protein
MSKGTGLPLHERTHFRRMREVFTEIAQYEHIEIEAYDLYNMCVYESVGDNQKGSNVSYDTEGNQSIWVFGNEYEIYEVPAKRNIKGWPYGDFLYIAYNTSFQYYMFGKMKVSLDKTRSVKTGTIVEDVHYEPYGKLTITFTKDKNLIHKEEFGYEFTPGVISSDHSFNFDKFNGRKLAYRWPTHKLLKEIGVNGVLQKKITGDTKVEKFKKNKKK